MEFLLYAWFYLLEFMYLWVTTRYRPQFIVVLIAYLSKVTKLHNKVGQVFQIQYREGLEHRWQCESIF